MSDLKKYLNEQMKDPEFKAEYERSMPEYEIMKAMVAARNEMNLTQKELAEKIGMRQSNISRIERGTCSPNIDTLRAIAEGLGKELHIEFR